MSELQQRTTTGLIMAGVFAGILILASISSLGRLLLALTGVTLAGIAGLEYCRFASNGKVRIVSFVLILAPCILSFSSVLFLSDTLDLSHAFTLGFVGGFFALALYLVIAGRHSLTDAGNQLGELSLAQSLIGLGGLALVLLALAPGGWRILLWLVAVVCANDIAAYFVGRSVGGPKLAPALSPGKTVSGTIGGLVGGLVAALATSIFLPGGISFTEIAICAVLVTVCAQLGDLIKSYLKRLHQVKDSGSILPGHGGVLDRIDGVCGGALMVAALRSLGLM